MCGLRFFARLWNEESGISTVEYALLLAEIATGIIATAESLANVMQNEVIESASIQEGDSKQW